MPIDPIVLLLDEIQMTEQRLRTRMEVGDPVYRLSREQRRIVVLRFESYCFALERRACGTANAVLG